ncbi:MAG: hypothetical protein ACYS9X_08705 [Planctomycetota bacterium]
MNADQAAQTARVHMAAIGSAKIATEQKEPQLRLSVEAEHALGGATIDPGSGRLIYLRLFPKPKTAGPGHEAFSHGHSPSGQEVIFIGEHVQWVADPPAAGHARGGTEDMPPRENDPPPGH